MHLDPYNAAIAEGNKATYQTSVRLDNHPSSTFEKLSPNLITFLQKGNKRFPVYCSHYASWVVIVNNLSSIQKEIFSKSALWAEATSEDLEWSKLCLDLIHDVRNKVDGETHQYTWLSKQ